MKKLRINFLSVTRFSAQQSSISSVSSNYYQARKGMPKNLLLWLFVSFFSLSAASSFGQKYTLSGYVKDASNGEYMIGATVFIKELGTGTTTNQYGFYSITLDQGNYNVVISFIGFNDTKFTIDLSKDIRRNTDLSAGAILTDEFEVVGEKSNENTDGTQMGKVDLEVEKIKALPAFLGEVDIMKTIQFLPGVQSAGEGNTGFYVRGGGPDQNLILLDEAVVYNASHLFGFFSVFNADAVKSIELTKGGMPANYGGRLASVLDISMKEGNSKEFHGEGGIGLISSRLTLEGPIKKDTSSFIISARRTYIDVLAEPFIPDTAAFAGSGYFFYDLNAKVNYRLSDKDRLFLSGYFGRDVFTFNDTESDFRVRIPWGNATTSLRWNHLFSDKLFLNTTAIFTDYQFEFGASQSQFEFKLFSGIRDYNLKMDFNYYPSIRHNVKFGMNYIYHTFTPNNASARSGDVEFDTGELNKMFAHEAAGYIQDEFDVSDKFKVNAGLRYSYFRQVGPFTRFNKDLNFTNVDTIDYGRGEKVADYGGLEPRISMRYRLPHESSIKAAYTLNYQYIHLASLSGVALPTDTWIPSSDRVKPQIGTQYNLGYFRNFKENLYEASVEVYYKDMNNLVEYREGAAPENDVNDNADNQLVFGDGYSYGAEFFLKKRTGKLNGWIGYTWSKTDRIFDDLNNGLKFPARYDRRHDLSIVAIYDLNDRWKFGATFVYATGSAITLPVQRYVIEGQIVNEFGERNGLRMNPFHRSDISATFTPKGTKMKRDPVTGEKVEVKKRIQSTWNFSIYNVYNRANPYFIFFDNEGSLADGTLDISAQQVSLFPILPSVTWNFKF